MLTGTGVEAEMDEEGVADLILAEARMDEEDAVALALARFMAFRSFLVSVRAIQLSVSFFLMLPGELR